VNFQGNFVVVYTLKETVIVVGNEYYNILNCTVYVFIVHVGVLFSVAFVQEKVMSDADLLKTKQV